MLASVTGFLFGIAGNFTVLPALRTRVVLMVE